MGLNEYWHVMLAIGGSLHNALCMLVMEDKIQSSFCAEMCLKVLFEAKLSLFEAKQANIFQS